MLVRMTNSLPDAPMELSRAGVDASDAHNDQPRADEWYVQDTRQHAGTSVLWWRRGGSYTSDLQHAEVFSQEAAARITALRGTDKAWSKAHIDAIAGPMVDRHALDEAHALTATARRCQMPCAGCTRKGLHAAP